MRYATMRHGVLAGLVGKLGGVTPADLEGAPGLRWTDVRPAGVEPEEREIYVVGAAWMQQIGELIDASWRILRVPHVLDGRPLVELMQEIPDHVALVQVDEVHVFTRSVDIVTAAWLDTLWSSLQAWGRAPHGTLIVSPEQHRRGIRVVAGVRSPWSLMVGQEEDDPWISQ